jgi:hypothetical protein
MDLEHWFKHCIYSMTYGSLDLGGGGVEGWGCPVYHQVDPCPGIVSGEKAMLYTLKEEDINEQARHVHKFKHAINAWERRPYLGV